MSSLGPFIIWAVGVPPFVFLAVLLCGHDERPTMMAFFWPITLAMGLAAIVIAIVLAPMFGAIWLAERIHNRMIAHD